MKTVCILYGGAEGKRTGSHMQRAIVNAGYTLSSDPSSADAIIAHSGGCYLIPKDLRAEKIILIGIPYWPGKSIARGTVQKTRHDAKHSFRARYRRWWTYKTAWNSLYIFQLHRAFNMLRGRAAGNIWRLPAQKTIVIRNEEDTFCMPDLQQLPFMKQPVLLTWSGGHDDCWIHPQKYVELLQS